jgi:hypothetical protein
MAKVSLELDDALLAAAAQALGTQGATDTVRAALEAAARNDGPRPRIPDYTPHPGPGRQPLGDPPLGPPETPGPGRTDFPRPPEIH